MAVASLDVDGLGVLVQGPCMGEEAGPQTDSGSNTTYMTKQVCSFAGYSLAFTPEKTL